jgi:hypothetical protein
MSINFKEVYGDRISEINKQIREAIKNKKWVEAAKLEAEKVDLQEKIKRIEGLSHGR